MKMFVLVSILFVASRSTAVDLDPRDYLALQSIRSSLYDLPGSAFFSTWDFTLDPCAAFSGLLCSAGRVVSLSLGDPRAGSPGLSGRLPDSLGLLTSLSDLSLLPGRVHGPIPASLSLCSSLRFLALSGNYLSGPIPASLASLPLLRTLDLSFNLLTGRLPPFHTPRLTNLILCHNHLSGPLPRSLPSSLLRLDLKRNNLTGPLPPLPPSLTYLSFSNNHLSGPVVPALLNLPRLNYLDLSFNRLSGPIPGKIFTLSTITNIHLNRNRFEGPLMGVPASGIAARTVDVSYNRLAGRIPAGLASAERIYLNFNGFVGRVPERFGERVRGGGIKVLYLQHNYLTGMDVGFVPASVSLCLNFNCMVPPPGNVCPVRVGRWKRRPAAECRRRGLMGD